MNVFAAKRFLRQHTNPLGSHLRVLVKKSNFVELEAQNKLLHLDIGCAKGQWCLDVAKYLGDQVSVAGIDVRAGAVDIADRTRRMWEEKGQIRPKTVRFMTGNPVFTSTELFRDLDAFSSVSFLFPDPIFKRSQWKRRVVQPSMLDALDPYLKNGAVVFVASDDYPTIAASAYEICTSPSYAISQTPIQEHLPSQPPPQNKETFSRGRTGRPRSLETLSIQDTIVHGFEIAQEMSRTSDPPPIDPTPLFSQKLVPISLSPLHKHLQNIPTSREQSALQYGQPVWKFVATKL